MINKGPIFIVGAGRSGTKLLRDIINNHSQISLCNDETHFIPNFFRKFRKIDGNYNKNHLKEYFDYLSKTSFYYSEELKLDLQTIQQNLKIFEPASFIEFVLKYYSHKYHPLKEFKYYWGDKSPLYALEIPILKEFFPQAKFIHIIRDPRDVSLSNKKTWSKSLFSSAEKWRKIIERSQIGKILLLDSYYEIYYERLINEPEYELEILCKYIGVDYEPEMIQLREPSEYFGDAKYSKVIMKNNVNKYERELYSYQIKRIEEIVKPMAIKKGYKLKYNVSYKPLNEFQKILFKYLDFYHFVLHIVFKERGPAEGLKYIYRSILNG